MNVFLTLGLWCFFNINC